MRNLPIWTRGIQPQPIQVLGFVVWDGIKCFEEYEYLMLSWCVVPFDMLCLFVIMCVNFQSLSSWSPKTGTQKFRMILSFYNAITSCDNYFPHSLASLLYVFHGYHEINYMWNMIKSLTFREDIRL